MTPANKGYIDSDLNPRRRANGYTADVSRSSTLNSLETSNTIISGTTIVKTLNRSRSKPEAVSIRNSMISGRNDQVKDHTADK